MSGLIKKMNLLNRLLHLDLVDVAQKLEELNLNLVMFATPWFVTVFTNLRCWTTVLRIFDIFFS